MLFAGGIEGRENGTLILACALALYYAVLLQTPPRLRRSLIKTLSVGLLAVLAVLTGGPVLLMAALALSAAGDYFLSLDGERPFLAGLASFLVAHVVYVVLFADMGGGISIFGAELWRGALAVTIGLFALAMLWLLMHRVGPQLRLPVAAYVAAIVAMGVAALSLHQPVVIVGALMFMASDSLLATERFLLPAISPHRVWMRYAVWGLYFAASFSSLWGSCCRGCQPAGASSKDENSKPGATVQPTSVQCAEASRRLPPVCRHDGLRPLAGRQVGAEPDGRDRPPSSWIDSSSGAPAWKCQTSTASRTRCQAEDSPCSAGSRSRSTPPPALRRRIAKRLGIPAALGMALHAERRDDGGGLDAVLHQKLSLRLRISANTASSVAFSMPRLRRMAGSCALR